MSHTPHANGYRDIAAALRREWTVAPWRAGEAAPTHQEIEVRFGSSRVTVQRTMDLLVRQGFLETRPKVGSFFAVRPPHLCHYGVLFPGHPGAITSWEWTRLSIAFHAAAQMLSQRGPWRLQPYFDLDVNSRGYQQLTADIDARLLAGLIFTHSQHELKQTPLLQVPPLPMAFHSARLAPGSLLVGWDSADWWAQAFAWLRGRGCRAAAVLGIDGVDPEDYEARLVTAGFAAPKNWVQCGNPYSHRWMRHNLTTMLEPRDGRRPDGLVIADDHLVEPAIAALVDLGVRIPQDLAVVAHWNAPLQYAGPVTVHLLAFDMCEVLRRSIEAIETQHAGKPVPADILLPAQPLQRTAASVPLADAQAALLRAGQADASTHQRKRSRSRPAASERALRSPALKPVNT